MDETYDLPLHLSSVSISSPPPVVNNPRKYSLRELEVLQTIGEFIVAKDISTILSCAERQLCLCDAYFLTCSVYKCREVDRLVTKFIWANRRPMITQLQVSSWRRFCLPF